MSYRTVVNVGLGIAVASALVAVPAYAADRPPPSEKLTITSPNVEATPQVYGDAWRPDWNTKFTLKYADTAAPLDPNRYEDGVEYSLLRIPEQVPERTSPEVGWGDGLNKMWLPEIPETSDRPFTAYLNKSAYDNVSNSVVTLDVSAPIDLNFPTRLATPKIANLTQGKNSKAESKVAPDGTKGQPLVAGKTVYIKFNGKWESGTTIDTRIGLVSGANGKSIYFLGSSGKNELPKGAKASTLVNKRGELVTSFALPKSAVGKALFATVIGSKPNRAARGFNWNNIPAGYPVVAAQPSSWVKSFGKKSGVAKVKKTVKVSSVTYSKTGKRAKLRSSYQWYYNGKTIKKATGKAYKIPQSVKGKTLIVKVTTYKKDMQKRSKTLSFGKVR